nr:MAG TPA: hypothetical protein [Caudoviricetes sp.]
MSFSCFCCIIVVKLLNKLTIIIILKIGTIVKQ